MTDSLPELYDKYESLVHETNPEIKRMLDSIGKTAFLGRQTLRVSSEIRKDLSLISSDYMRNMEIVRRFKTTYKDHFTSMNDFATGIMDESTIKLNCVSKLRYSMLDISRIGQNIASDVIFNYCCRIFYFLDKLYLSWWRQGSLK